NEQSDDEFEEFDNKKFNLNQISIYRATSIAESTGATEVFENLLVRFVSSMSTESNIKRKKTEIEVSNEIVAVKKRTEELDPKKLFYENVHFLVEDYERKQKRLTGKNELTANVY
ncbi:23534_t:CDS:2, partial [Cetraspora pellucida]